MNRKKVEAPPEDRTSQLERRARVVRSRLLRAVDALDVRRHQIAELGRQTKRIAIPAALSALGIAVLVGVGVVTVTVALARRRRRSLSYRLTQGVSAGASKAMKRLEAMGQPSLVRRVLDKVTLTALSLAAGEVTKRLARNALDGRFADGRLAVGKALERYRAGIVATVIPPDGAAR